MRNTTNSSEDGWNKPNAQQQVSNRSIFRVQELSNDLRNQLKEIPIFDTTRNFNIGPIANVFFVSRDYVHESREQKDGLSYTRWYNLRLCDSYDLSKDLRMVVRDCLDSKVDRREQFQCFFDAVKKIDPNTRCSFEAFKRAVEDPHDQKHRMAVEQLMMALAVLPYRGVLLDAFEEVFGFKTEKKSKEGCFYFYSTEKKDDSSGYPLFSFSPFTKFQLGKRSETIPMPPMEFTPQLDAEKEFLTVLFKDFLNPFARGLEPKPRFDGSLLYDDNQEDLNGFVVPAYDIWQEDEWLGGMAGWLVVCLHPSTKEKVRNFFNEGGNNDSQKIALCEHSWINFTHLVRAYVRRIREAHMRDIVEDYPEKASSTSPKSFFEQHIHQVIGWKKYINDLNVSDEGRRVKITVPLDADGDVLRVSVEELKDTHWDGYPKCSFRENGCRKGYPKPCSEVAVEQCRGDKKFPPGTRRLCKLFIEELKLIEAQRQHGQQAGILISVHDYSKEIGSACLRMMDLNKTLVRSRDAIRERTLRLAQCSEPSPTFAREIERELARMEAPRIDWFSGVRFTNAHLQTQTTGAIIGEPAECVALLESGTLRDIYDLVRILVWLPFDYAGYKEIENSLCASRSLQMKNPATWAYLFRYDIVPNQLTNPFHKQLGERIAKLILDEQITEGQFFSRFQPPVINLGTDLDHSVLWDASGAEASARWRPVDGLLPLFVFSLRFAFQCAWGKTLIEAPPRPESIRVIASRPQARSYQIEIDFPSPVSIEGNNLESIPYFGEWLRQMSHYDERTYPWRVEHNSVKHASGSNRIMLCITASI